MRLVDIAGEKFGRLLAIRREGTIGRAAAWLCLCDCGIETIKPGTMLRRGHVTSCGCYKADVIAAGANTRHGMRQSLTYRIWSGIKSRCHNPNNPAFESYGARGIFVCERWRQSFEAFLADMGKCPEGMSIDRIDNDGPYAPGNCRWASPLEQSNNTRRNVRIEYDGRVMSISEWARKCGMNPDRLKSRLANGWSIERALSTPIDETRARLDFRR